MLSPVEQSFYENSEKLLLYLLKSLNAFRVSILPLISELYIYYPEFGGEFGALEYSFLDL